MASPLDDAKVAIYWDFENLHATLYDVAKGSGAYKKDRYQAQGALVNVNTVVEYASTLGNVIINKAYGNWQWFHKYGEQLNGSGVDLIQLYPRGQNMKNSADVRLALDAISDIYTLPHLTHIVVVSSDMDFISLAQKVRQAGKFVAGVGIQNVSNRFWMSSCDEFRFYETLVGLSEQATAQPPPPPASAATNSKGSSQLPVTEPLVVAGLTMDEARKTLKKAMTQLVHTSGENHVQMGHLKNVMRRMLPAFDERLLKCKSFTHFIERSTDVVKIVDAEGGGHVALNHYRPPESEASEASA